MGGLNMPMIKWYSIVGLKDPNFNQLQMNKNGIGTIEHNEMFMRPSSMAYVQGGRPLDPRLEGKDDLNRCEAVIPYSRKTLYLYAIHMTTVIFRAKWVLYTSVFLFQ